jgi:hypothetical protein
MSIYRNFGQNVNLLSINTKIADNTVFINDPKKYIYDNNIYPSLSFINNDDDIHLNNFLNNTVLKRACCMRSIGEDSTSININYMNEKN